MPLTNELKKKVEDLAWTNDQTSQDEILKLLKEAITSGETTPQDIFDYKGSCWKKPTLRYVIEAATLNRLGVFISKSENDEHKKLAGPFYKAAADRDSSWGCRNYAALAIDGNELRGVLKSPQAALQYAQKAVELTKSSAAPHEHKAMFAKALRANQKPASAILAMTEYLTFYLHKNNTQFKKDVAQDALNLIEEILNELSNGIDDADTPLPSPEILGARLSKIKSVLEKKLSYATDNEIQTKINVLTQHLKYLYGRYSEILEEDMSEAMRVYCDINDDSPYYRQAVVGRARLLKQTVKNMLLVVPSDVTTDIASQLAATSLSEASASDAGTLIASSMMEQTSFAKHWKKGNPSFDLVYPEQLAEDYQQTIEEINTLINAKKIEIKLLEKKSQKLARGSSADSAVLITELDTKLKCLKAELNALNDVKNKVSAAHQQHLPSHRQILRRGASEARFFNPHRLKNKRAIVELAYQIIDQRFGLATHPVNLTGISVRHFAAAEKAFQNAIIQLTGKDRPKTGIPIARSSPWDMGYSSGSNNFGPRENYLIGETPIVFEHRENPKTQRLGDSFSPDHGRNGTYDGSIYPFLKKLTQGDAEKEKQLARLLINFGKKQQPISLATLQEFLPSADEEMVHQFNRVCALIMAKEQVQWLSATDDKFRGLAVMHARCLLLIEKGFLTLAEVFQNDGIFSVYSNKNIIYNSSRLEAACLRVESLYDEYLKILHSQDYFKMFRADLAAGKKASTVASREQDHQDLRNIYGGESDSDGEEYASDLEFSGPGW